MRIPDTETIERLRGLDSYLGSRILGQEEVIGDITRLVQRAFCGIRLPNRPIASMLFLGPTGVGKTETAELLTHRLFGTRVQLIRLDLRGELPSVWIYILAGPTLHEAG